MPQHTAPQLMHSWLAAWAGVLALILSACGSQTATQNPVAAGPDLCQVTADVEGLVVQRISYASGPPRFSFPAEVAITKPAVARKIAAYVCQLPAAPSGGTVSDNCPAEVGIKYVLHIKIINYGMISINADPTGCESVWGQGLATRSTVLSPGFWQALGTAMGLRRPNGQTFVGTHPSV